MLVGTLTDSNPWLMNLACVRANDVSISLQIHGSPHLMVYCITLSVSEWSERLAPSMQKNTLSTGSGLSLEA